MRKAEKINWLRQGAYLQVIHETDRSGATRWTLHVGNPDGTLGQQIAANVSDGHVLAYRDAFRALSLCTKRE